MNFRTKFEHLCSPAQFYFVLSMIGISVGIVSNLLFNETVRLPSHFITFIVALFWTWVLNAVCRDGFNTLSWAMVLIPYMLMFIVSMLSILSLIKVNIPMGLAKSMAIYSAVVVSAGGYMMNNSRK